MERGIKVLQQLLPNVVNNFLLLMELERSCVLVHTVHGTRFAGHAFNQHSYRHSRWESMRVNEHIRTETAL